MWEQFKWRWPQPSPQLLPRIISLISDKLRCTDLHKRGKWLAPDRAGRAALDYTAVVGGGGGGVGDGEGEGEDGCYHSR